MKDFIYEKENSLSEDICNKFINYYEENEDLISEDLLISRNNKNIKNLNKRNSKGIDIHFFDKYIILKDVLDDVKKELFENIIIYFHTLINKNIIVNELDKISINTISIHKYNINEGFFSYHQDYTKTYTKTDEKKRFISFIWYLNDVDEGGETEFFGYYKIKPKKGKLLLFPSDWLFPHSSKKSISDNKYILSGWIFKDI